MNEAKRILGDAAQDMKQGSSELSSSQKTGVAPFIGLLARIATSLHESQPRKLKNYLDTAAGKKADAEEHIRQGLERYRGVVGGLVQFEGPAREVDAAAQRSYDLVSGTAGTTQPGELSIPDKIAQLYGDLDQIESIATVLRDTVEVAMQRARDLGSHLNAVEGVTRDTSVQMKRYRDLF